MRTLGNRGNFNPSRSDTTISSLGAADLHFFISAAPSFLHEPPMGASSLKNQISKVQKKREMGVFFLTSADSVNEDVSLMKAFAALSNEVARFAR